MFWPQNGFNFSIIYNHLNIYIFKTTNFSNVYRPFLIISEIKDYLRGFVEFDMQLFRFTVQLDIEIKTKTKQNVNFCKCLKLRN
jgi:hypothetical protein